MLSDPEIIVAKRSWPVPLLAPRQNRIVVPLLLSGKRDYESLLALTYAALSRAHAWLSYAEFEDWPVPYCELIGAVPVIATQTGLLSEGPSHASERSAGARTGPDWDLIIAQFVNFLPGTTPDYWEDALTVPRLDAMYETWRLYPPVAVLVAGYFGYKPRPRALEAVQELLRLFPSGRLKLE
jgi:hypothetical protein